MGDNNIKLTEFSHGGGCGCKLSPEVLERILKTTKDYAIPSNLIVGNETKDDATVCDIGGGIGIISTTDFFMPIVDNPYKFGYISAVNAISDIYAMGGKPILGIAILGWPINILSPDIASQVIEGGREACIKAGIALSGGHSIDTPEPIFGLAVTGSILLKNIKRNNTATPGCNLYLTKPIGIGILTTAEKKSLLSEKDKELVTYWMCYLNQIGEELGKLSCVKAMTDVTGFGLFGHLIEMCEGSNVLGVIDPNAISFLPNLKHYIEKGCSPGGAKRNYESYKNKILIREENHSFGTELPLLLSDPQTSGGLLIAVEKGTNEILVQDLFKRYNISQFKPIGYTTERNNEFHDKIVLVI